MNPELAPLAPPSPADSGELYGSSISKYRNAADSQIARTISLFQIASMRIGREMRKLAMNTVASPITATRLNTMPNRLSVEDRADPTKKLLATDGLERLTATNIAHASQMPTANAMATRLHILASELTTSAPIRDVDPINIKGGATDAMTASTLSADVMEARRVIMSVHRLVSASASVMSPRRWVTATVRAGMDES